MTRGDRRPGWRPCSDRSSSEPLPGMPGRRGPALCPISGVGIEISLHPVGPGDRLGEESDGLVDPLVGLGATEAEEAAARLAEALAAEAGDAEVVVGPFEQVERQAVRADPQPVADRADVREDVE